ncbi:DEAD/DEAH box helicase [Pseudonocardiaceae bacterium YIM PH 21723]|nr:DEAD/DEAH box helicase [Pseudonocardiaceae bacterium YIM PH 21723]
MARQSVDYVGTLFDRIEVLRSAPATLRERAARQLAGLADQLVVERLQRCPLAELRPTVARGTRLAKLEEAGFHTVADVLAAGQHRLAAVPGAGQHTVLETLKAAQLIREGMRSEVRVRLDPEQRGPMQDHLMALLAAIRSTEAAVTSLNPAVHGARSEVMPLAKQARAATGRWRFFWSSRASKDAALVALDRLEAVLATPELQALDRRVHEAQRATDPDNYRIESLWADFESNAAAVNSLLSTLGTAGRSDDDAAQGFVGSELRQRINAVPLDTSRLNATLRGYQVFGAQYVIHQQQAILGDEMGLGKTVQALAVCAHLSAHGQHRFLVVCPASVQINWLREIEKHTNLEPYSLHGRDRDTAAAEWAHRGGVAVTTFNTLGSLDPQFLTEVALLVVDEAHYVKNPDTRRAGYIRAMIGRSQRTLFMTGTPMENRVEEFRRLVEYLQPAVAARISADDVLAGARAFRRAVAPVYLRRNQEDVLTELPAKIEVEEWVSPSRDDDRHYYDAVVSKNMMAMRRAAYRAADSAKLDRLREIVEEAVEDGRKVLVFSFFHEVLDAIQKSLSVPVYGPVTGKNSSAVRQRKVEEFTSHRGGAALLGQITALGEGLNIQAASVVILAEPQWKPSAEDQAIARAYRMGQVRPVQVYRLLAKGTVDERVREILERKQLLFDEFARRSVAKESNREAVNSSYVRPTILDDESVPLEHRVILAERYRLGIDRMPPEK